MSETTAAAEAAWNDAATSAYQRIAEESGKSLTQIAADMEVREYTLERFIRGVSRWSLDGVLRLAASTGQNPARMLGREAMP